uniref:Uncharacterized protein n=1 Tax=viral metagenome TaxID=1070528 RepID=A0A6C0KF69_9ZZZZ
MYRIYRNTVMADAFTIRIFNMAGDLVVDLRTGSKDLGQIATDTIGDIKRFLESENIDNIYTRSDGNVYRIHLFDKDELAERNNNYLIRSNTELVMFVDDPPAPPPRLVFRDD